MSANAAIRMVFFKWTLLAVTVPVATGYEWKRSTPCTHWYWYEPRIRLDPPPAWLLPAGQTMARWDSSRPPSSRATDSAAATMPESRAGRERASRAVRVRANVVSNPAMTSGAPIENAAKKPRASRPAAAAARRATRILTISGRGTSEATSAAAETARYAPTKRGMYGCIVWPWALMITM